MYAKGFLAHKTAMNEGVNVLSVSILEANSFNVSAHQNNALTYFIAHSSICPFLIQVFGIYLIMWAHKSIKGFGMMASLYECIIIVIL